MAPIPPAVQPAGLRLAGRDIVVFGDDWGHYPSTMQHLGSVLAEENRILWIGSLGLRKPRVHWKDAVRIVQKGRRILRATKPVAHLPAVTELYPFVIPLHDTPLLRRWNMRRIRSRVQKTMTALGFSRPVLLTSSPIVADLIGEFGESSSHYVCLDDWTGFEGAFSCLAREEERLLERVNSCFAVSDTLMRTRRARRGPTSFLPQGVDLRHFRRPAGPVPGVLTALKPPVAGFFGLLAPFLDLDLLVTSARSNPDVTFLIIGRAAVDTSALQAVPNIHYVGEVPYEDLPNYAQVFDVGLIPFVLNDLTRAANPLKFLEYLAMGIPVVSTDLPELRKFGDGIYRARSAEEFIAGIRAALTEDSPERREARRELAAAYSWRSIARMMGETILDIETAARPDLRQ